MKYSLILSILGVLFSLKSFAQTNIDSLLAYSSKQWASFPMEILYLQTSKSTYETGEDLWFKGYQLDAQSFALSDKSKTLYLQMINPADSVVWQEKYPIENGIVSGHVYIDEKLLEGDYLLQGYTKHSFYKNDTTGIIPARKVKIMKNISHSAVAETPQDTTFRFKMFPEGGNLVSGIPSILAFKATDGKGNPVFVEGAVYQDNEPLIEVKSIHYGMGTVLFTPLQDKTYRIELKNGKSYPLPTIHSQGMVLRLIKQDKKELNFMVSQSNSLPNQQIYLIGQMRGMVCCMAKGVLKDNLNISISLDNFLYQGIAEFTLFDSQMQPIAERLVYIHPEKKLHITAEPDKERYTLREKGTIKIKITNEEGNPVRANIGVSVYDQAYNNPANPVNILSYYYLSSQIRGKIYNPAYYFDERNNGQTEGMELLLLTQGWRRYVWNTISSFYEGQPFLTDEINGTQTLKKNTKEKQSQNSEQLIKVSGPTGNTLFVWADSLGQFTVSTDMMKGLRGGYIYLKPMLSEKFKPELAITDYFSVIDSLRKNRSNYYPVMNLLPIVRKQEFDFPIASQDSTILLEEVVVVGKGRKPFRDKFMGRLDSLAQKDLGPWVCKHGWLENYKEGYTHHHDSRYCPCVVDDGEPRTVPIIGHRYHIQKNEYFQCNAKGSWCFKPIDSQWIIYEGANYSEEELLRMNNLWRTKGYYSTREFYQPDEVDLQLSTPDARNTLLWEPSVITDEKGEATVSFYCSDINTRFIGVVEGADGTGLLGTSKFEFNVIRK